MEGKVSTLNIVTWNCHSLYANLSPFKIFLYSTKPHIVCLCETWLVEDRLPAFVNYTSFFVCRPQRNGGGLAILARNDLCVARKNIDAFPDGHLECQAVSVSGVHDCIDILNVYNPLYNVSAEEYMFYFQQLTAPNIVVGDSNAHHGLWSSKGRSNVSGNNLITALYSFPDLCLLTPRDFHTYFHVPTRQFSTLDLCFLSSELFSLANLSSLDDLGSDHVPLLISLNFAPIIVKFQTRQRWIFGQNDQWAIWRAALPPSVPVADFQSNYDLFAERLLDASLHTFKMTSGCPSPKYSKVWWTARCSALISERKRAKNLFHRHPTNDNLIFLRQVEARVKSAVKTAKKDSFKQFCNVLNRCTPTSLIWQRIGQLRGKSPRQVTMPLVVGGTALTHPTDKANALADHYELLFNKSSHQVDSQTLLLPVSLALLDDSLCDYNSPITMAELSCAIQMSRATAPGHDLIHNTMFQNMPDDYREWALSICNQSFDSSSLLPSWKLAHLNPIVKPLKDASFCNNFRPLSLLQCFSKLMGRIINRRLNYHLESGSYFSRTQAGFRKRLCTFDQIARLEQVIRHSLATRSYCIAIFFDLSGAYDSIYHLGLLYKLSRRGVKGKLLRWVKDFLTERTFQVLLGGSLSSTRPITTGVPQGSVLSPTLFNVMLADLPSTPHVHMAEYADDIVVFATGWNYDMLCQNVQLQVDRVHAWMQRWGFTLNPAKTKGMIYALVSHRIPNITLGDSAVEFVRSHKYLGLTFDAPRLSWGDHLSYLKGSCLGRVNLLKSVSGSHWGADRSVLLQFYNSFIRSKLDYGSIFYSTASKTSLSTLDKIQNMCLRIALGVKSTTPILSLEAESNIPPLQIHRLNVLFRYMSRFTELPSDLPVTQELLASSYKFCHIQWSSHARVAPVMVRGRQLLKTSQFPFILCPSASLISPCPPWFDLNSIICTDFTALPVRYLSPLTAQQVLMHLLDSTYGHYLAIYTDGSRLTEPDVSVGAAVVVQQGNTFVSFKWKLPHYSSILGAELYAIFRALQYLKVNSSVSVCGVVILSDSQSGLELIKSPCPSNYVSLVLSIHDLVMSLLPRFPVRFQYVPGHKNIIGNEEADKEAKLAHDLTQVTPFSLSAQDRNYHFRFYVTKYWQQYYDQEVLDSGRGAFLRMIKPCLAHWPWATHESRLVETAMAKLRVGHANVASYLYRINKRESPQCACGQAETIPHLLLLCVQYSTPRSLLQQSLISLDVGFTLVNLLGGGPYDPSIQALIVSAVVKFLVDCRRLSTL